MQVTADAARKVLSGEMSLSTLLDIPRQELADMAAFAYDLWRQGRRVEARQMFQTLAATAPDIYYGHAGLGLVALQDDQYEEAETHLTRAAQLEPGDASVLVNLGETLLRLHRLADALPVLQRAAAADPSLRHPGAARAAAILIGIGEGLTQSLPVTSQKTP